jgi:hypothetical protein
MSTHDETCNCDNCKEERAIGKKLRGVPDIEELLVKARRHRNIAIEENRFSPAFPTVVHHETMSDGQTVCQRVSYDDRTFEHGLSKREEFAKACLASICSLRPDKKTIREDARLACDYADALLAALEDTKCLPLDTGEE